MITTVPIIEIDKIGKAYRYYGSEWQRVLSWFGLNFKPNHEHWTLEAITFKIYPQEAIGILGKNGAGKSTLLKIISGILKPSTGTIQVRGRIAAILELGMGFQPDLTGRQNAYHATGLMGYSQKQIDTVINDIESFADIGEYFDQPVRTYSSGMQARVAFSIAVAFRPEILIVDEVLSVGDAAFQRKCFRKIEEFMEAGTTLLFVSHDIETVKKICNKALFIKNGLIEGYGNVKEICDNYEKDLFDKSTTQLLNTPGNGDKSKTGALSCEIIYGNGDAEITSNWIEDLSGKHIDMIETGSNIIFNFKVLFNKKIDNPIFNIQVKTREGIILYGVNSKFLSYATNTVKEGEILVVSFLLENHFAPGTYYFNCGVRIDTEKGSEFLSRRVDSCLLNITQSKYPTVAMGLIDLGAKMTINKENK